MSIEMSRSKRNGLPSLHDPAWFDAECMLKHSQSARTGVCATIPSDREGDRLCRCGNRNRGQADQPSGNFCRSTERPWARRLFRLCQRGKSAATHTKARDYPPSWINANCRHSVRRPLPPLLLRRQTRKQQSQRSISPTALQARFSGFARCERAKREVGSEIEGDTAKRRGVCPRVFLP